MIDYLGAYRMFESHPLRQFQNLDNHSRPTEPHVYKGFWLLPKNSLSSRLVLIGLKRAPFGNNLVTSLARPIRLRQACPILPSVAAFPGVVI